MYESIYFLEDVLFIKTHTNYQDSLVSKVELSNCNRFHKNIKYTSILCSV